jgi:hypothetical protein
MSSLPVRRLVDYFFVCGLSSTLEPYDAESKLTFKGETLSRFPLADHANAAALPPHVWMVREIYRDL